MQASELCLLYPLVTSAVICSIGRTRPLCLYLLPFSFYVGNITVALSLSKTTLFRVTSVEPFTFEIVPEIHPEIHLNANCKQCEKRVEWWFAMLTFGLCCLLSYFPVPGC